LTQPDQSPQTMSYPVHSLPMQSAGAIACQRCGYDLSGVPGSGPLVTCPECGAQIDPRAVTFPRSAAVRFIFITAVLDVLGFGLLIPVAPRLVEQLQHGNEAQAAPVVGLLSATFGLMLFLFAPVLGTLSDSVGRRPVILFALFGSGIDYIAQAFV